MNKLYIITGANGHLGNTIIKLLKNRSVKIRGLILPEEQILQENQQIEYIRGDIRDRESLLPLFANLGNQEVYLIHTAGLIDISQGVSEALYEVNVNGTRNILSLCREFAVKRLLYVSSVHAIPEKSSHCVLKEINHFSPLKVTGGYAKTKAKATQEVLNAAKDGLDAVVVHPSGILGPYDYSHNHLVQMVSDYMRGRLPACVKGGYDFVDVRDVALGCLLALEKGKKGECYILSNRHYEIREVLQMVRGIYGGRKLPVLPVWMANAAAPIIQQLARWKKTRPLYTKYSLHTLLSNDKFSHDKATLELGYMPRDLIETIRDTLAFLSCPAAPQKMT